MLLLLLFELALRQQVLYTVANVIDDNSTILLTTDSPVVHKRMPRPTAADRPLPTAVEGLAAV